MTRYLWADITKDPTDKYGVGCYLAGTAMDLVKYLKGDWSGWWEWYKEYEYESFRETDDGPSYEEYLAEKDAPYLEIQEALDQGADTEEEALEILEQAARALEDLEFDNFMVRLIPEDKIYEIADPYNYIEKLDFEEAAKYVKR